MNAVCNYCPTNCRNNSEFRLELWLVPHISAENRIQTELLRLWIDCDFSQSFGIKNWWWTSPDSKDGMNNVNHKTQPKFIELQHSRVSQVPTRGQKAIFKTAYWWRLRSNHFWQYSQFSLPMVVGHFQAFNVFLLQSSRLPDWWSLAHRSIQETSNTESRSSCNVSQKRELPKKYWTTKDKTELLLLKDHTKWNYPCKEDFRHPAGPEGDSAYRPAVLCSTGPESLAVHLIGPSQIDKVAPNVQDEQDVRWSAAHACSDNMRKRGDCCFYSATVKPILRQPDQRDSARHFPVGRHQTNKGNCSFEPYTESTCNFKKWNWSRVHSFHVSLLKQSNVLATFALLISTHNLALIKAAWYVSWDLWDSFEWAQDTQLVYHGSPACHATSKAILNQWAHDHESCAVL